MLETRDLVVEVTGKNVVEGVSIQVGPGMLHVLMGPNGSGKSSLAYAIMGHPNYTVVEGRVFVDGEDVTGLSPDERARKGLFLLFQNPVEIPGVKIATLLIASLNKKLGNSDLMQSIPGFSEKLEVEAKYLVYQGSISTGT